ncbi:MAG: signal recognition particle-docking protein FtsY [Actinobacteria bacterium]|nr:signal recognition particle-docking protein FtsY [Actinomycetota bacterium]
MGVNDTWVLIAAVAVAVVVGAAVFALRSRRSHVTPPAAPPAPVAPTAPVVPAAAAPVAPTAPVVPAAAALVTPAAPLSFRDRLARARGVFATATAGVLRRSAIDQATWDELEEAMLRADLGVKVASSVLDSLRERVKRREITDVSALVAALRGEMVARLASAHRELTFDLALGAPNIWLVVGVNGAGKTTSIGKIAAQQIAAGRSVLMAAGDTFRAAAGEQLEEWSRRTGAAIVRGAEGADPSSVVFDGVQSAAARGTDLVLADTAGRLQTNTNLMDELRKVRRVAEKAAGAVTEVLLVIDATTGQNGLVQARQFAEATQVTGVVLTKLDGSAKGGIVFAIETELGIPIKLVGLGETVGDLAPFDAREFVDALFDD